MEDTGDALESAYGSVRPAGPTQDFKAISRNAKDAKAEETARELSEARGSATQP